MLSHSFISVLSLEQFWTDMTFYLMLVMSLLPILVTTVDGVHLFSSVSGSGVRSGEQVTIKCSLEERYHDVKNIRWSGPAIDKDKDPMHVAIESDEIGGVSTLIINNIGEDDEGIYTCTHDDSSASVKVTVNHRPYYGNAPMTQDFVEGDDARILCPVYLGDPAGIMIWFHGKKLLQDDPHYVFHEDELDQSLEIRSIQKSDSGLYRCTILSGIVSIIRDIAVVVNQSQAGVDKPNQTGIFWYTDDLASSSPYFQPTTIAIVLCLAVVVLVLLLTRYTVLWFRKKRMLNQRKKEILADHIYETIDERILAPLPVPPLPVRALQVRTSRNIAYESLLSHYCDTSGIVLCSSSGDCSPHNSESVVCINDSDFNSETQDSMSDCDELSELSIQLDDNIQRRNSNHFSTTRKIPSINQSGNAFDEEDECEFQHAIFGCNDRNDFQAQCHDDDQIHTSYKLIGGYEAIGGYERAPPIDIDHLSQCLPVSVPQNKHCDSFEVANSIDNDGVDDTVTFDPAQDSNDYDQIQGYELIGGYEAIGGYERAPPINTDRLSKCVSNLVPQNDCCSNNLEVANSIDDNNDEVDKTITVNQAQDSNDYDQIQGYELIGGYEKIGGYERAPNFDINFKIVIMT